MGSFASSILDLRSTRIPNPPGFVSSRNPNKERDPNRRIQNPMEAAMDLMRRIPPNQSEMALFAELSSLFSLITPPISSLKLTKPLQKESCSSESSRNALN
ncbi:uncharacterized protein A4U43_C04F15330 [Asparagus officinalis]|uniref:Uncharacterized protein n=1 Tax=Asparagus officinalis TaxID=4686 RepID=A0A5P1F135_ASPOF|nr:uncharacterized protein A4U43_C04F15330 [Asparagus officinalis]